METIQDQVLRQISKKMLSNGFSGELRNKIYYYLFEAQSEDSSAKIRKTILQHPLCSLSSRICLIISS
jgi:hypothetical protein